MCVYRETYREECAREKQHSEECNRPHMPRVSTGSQSDVHVGFSLCLVLSVQLWIILFLLLVQESANVFVE